MALRNAFKGLGYEIWQTDDWKRISSLASRC
jgi:hypothetical protein